jgi:hypothetical protein
MSTAHITKRLVPARARDAVVAGYYLLTILMGIFVILVRRTAADLTAALFYSVATVALYLVSVRGQKER